MSHVEPASAGVTEPETSSPAAEIIVRAEGYTEADRERSLREPRLSHGCYTPALLIPEAEAIALEIRQMLLEECPWLTTLDGLAVEMLAMAMARIRRGEQWLQVHTDFDKRKAAHRRVVSDLRGWYETARRLQEALGLHPSGRMNLKVGQSRSRALDAAADAPLPADEVEALEQRIIARLAGNEAATPNTSDRDGPPRPEAGDGPAGGAVYACADPSGPLSNDQEAEHD